MPWRGDLLVIGAGPAGLAAAAAGLREGLAVVLVARGGIPAAAFARRAPEDAGRALDLLRQARSGPEEGGPEEGGPSQEGRLRLLPGGAVAAIRCDGAAGRVCLRLEDGRRVAGAGLIYAAGRDAEAAAPPALLRYAEAEGEAEMMFNAAAGLWLYRPGSLPGSRWRARQAAALACGRRRNRVPIAAACWRGRCATAGP
ncbi:hypothetical protein [Brevirhabdus sp.]|uniref:hypothetical protein n=1 Tax=Brevirhabdus sp. TaxID=2004514 RepID=UPI0040588B86